MKFKFIINKWGNFYFFIQSLSEWHFSCRKEYNNLWQKELGILSPEEKKALKTFKKIRLNHKVSKSYFEIAFFTKQNPWDYLKLNLSLEEYKDIKKVFDIFEDKFKNLYLLDLPLLKKWQILLNKKGNQQEINQKIILTLDNLYNTNIQNKDIIVKVYLLFSSSKISGGGANIDQKSISLEISRLPLEEVNHTLGVIWHETIHLLFQNEMFFPLILKNNNKGENVNLINEVTTAALFPRGILSKWFFNVNITSNLYPRSLTPEKTTKVLKLLHNYLYNHQALDIHYIKKIKNILEI